MSEGHEMLYSDSAAAKGGLFTKAGALAKAAMRRHNTDYWESWWAKAQQGRHTHEREYIERLRSEVAGLRAILAPLLDQPMVMDSCYDDNAHYSCLHCPVGNFYAIDEGHYSGCPVLRKAELLGR